MIQDLFHNLLYFFIDNSSGNFKNAEVVFNSFFLSLLIFTIFFPSFKFKFQVYFSIFQGKFTKLLYSRLLKTESLDNAILEPSDWLSHHGIGAIIPCSSNMLFIKVIKKGEANEPFLKCNKTSE